jgi:hypothetical protein
MWESYLLFEGNYKEGKRKVKTRTVIRRSRRTQLPLRESGAASFDAVIYTLRSEDSGLPSNPIRQVQEIADMCVLYEPTPDLSNEVGWLGGVSPFENLGCLIPQLIQRHYCRDQEERI